LVIWMAFGLTFLAPLTLAHGSTELDSPPLLAATLAAAALWAFSPLKWRALRTCHLTQPLPPDGAKADKACAAEGLRYGRLCLIADAPLMLVMAMAGHGALLLMALLSMIVGAEKLAMQPSAYRQPMAATLIGVAALAFGLGPS